MLPNGFTSRPPTMDDVEAVVEVENQRAIHDIGSPDTTVERTRMFWEEPERSLATDNLVVLDSSGRVVAYADYSEYEPYTTVEIDFAVLPGYEDLGIEEHLLDWAVRRAASALEKAHANEPVTLETRVWATNERLQQRLIANGFAPSRVWHRMQIDMDAPRPDPVWPDGVSVRAFDPAEIDAVHEAWEDAQRDEWGFSSLTDEEFRYYFVEREANFDPTLWFLAIDDATGQIVGYVLARWERPGEPEVGHVRYVAVRRPYRRRGIALALLLAAFAEFYRRGKRSVSLGVDSTSLTGADRLYLRAGMRPTQSTIILSRPLRPATP